MIQDKTEYFLKIRQRPTTPYDPLSMDASIRLLNLLDTNIQLLENRMEMSTLPNFGCGQKINQEIIHLKKRIQEMARDVENGARVFTCEEATVQTAVQQHILTRLQVELVKFKRLQQKQLCNEVQQTSEAPDAHCTYLENPDAESTMVLDTVQRTNNIKSSICNVTNTLIQLKITLKAQTGLIDTIDSCFENSTMNLNRANKEIEKLPGRYCGFKDCIIYVLLYIIIILLVLIFMKSYKKKVYWLDPNVLMVKAGLKH